MKRRDLIKSGAVLLAAPSLILPNIASAQQARNEAMTRSQRRIEHNAALKRHNSRVGAMASNGRPPEGMNQESFTRASSTMGRGFNDRSQSHVAGTTQGQATFGQSRSDGNRCNAFLRQNYQNDGCCDETMAQLQGTENVTLLEGPALLTMGTICEEYSVEVRRSFSSSQSVGILRDDCLPHRAGSRSLMSFERITSNNVDVIFSKRTEIVISYRYSSSSRQWAESRFTMTSRSTKEIVFEGAFEYRTGLV